VSAAHRSRDSDLEGFHDCASSRKIISSQSSHDDQTCISANAEMDSNEDAKKPGDISAAFVSLSGTLKDAEPLDDRYRVLKNELLGSDEQKKKKWISSWTTLLSMIERKATDTKREGFKYIPTIDYADVKDAAFNWQQLQKSELGNRLKSFSDLYRERGVAVIRNVIPREEILGLKDDLKDYINDNKDHVNGFPVDNKQVFELYWTKAQSCSSTSTHEIGFTVRLISLAWPKGRRNDRQTYHSWAHKYSGFASSVL